MSVSYNGVNYYYAANLQGDVAAILDAAGTAVVEYTYDAWGNPLTVTGSLSGTLGNTNSLRYRGYVYDNETGMYYLQSRYYNPEIGRFFNADVYASTGQGLLGNNMFAYCNNSPVVSSDPSGTRRVCLPGVSAGTTGGGVRAATYGDAQRMGEFCNAYVAATGYEPDWSYFKEIGVEATYTITRQENYSYSGLENNREQTLNLLGDVNMLAGIAGLFAAGSDGDVISSITCVAGLAIRIASSNPYGKFACTIPANNCYTKYVVSLSWVETGFGWTCEHTVEQTYLCYWGANGGIMMFGVSPTWGGYQVR